MMHEAQVEKYLLELVKAAGGLCIKLGLRGLPDRMVLLGGGVIGFVELKRPGEKPTAIQDLWLRRLRALGFAAVCCDTLESVRAFVQTLQPGRRC